MTLENSKKLYTHYVAVGNKAAAEDMKENLLRKGIKVEDPVDSDDSKKRKK